MIKMAGLDGKNLEIIEIAPKQYEFKKKAFTRK